MMANTYNHGVVWEEGSGISQGYSVNGTIDISGQLSHDMESTFIGAGDIEVQTKQTLENLDRVLTGFGASKSNLSYVEIYLTNVKEHVEPCIKLFKNIWGNIGLPAASLA
jgi:enamine deaminase RidA (YjgF/YER057c/UK114 family)